MDPGTCDAVSASPMGSSRARLPADGGHIGQDQPGPGPPAGEWSCWGTRVTLAQVASEGANSWRRPAHCCPHLRTARAWGGGTQVAHFHSAVLVNSSVRIFHKIAIKAAIWHYLRQTAGFWTGCFLSKPLFSP